MGEQFIPLLSFVGTLAVVVVGFLYNNSRMTDFKDLIKAEAVRSDANIAKVEANLARVEGVLSAQISKSETELLGRFAELDNRLSRIEAHLNLR